MAMEEVHSWAGIRTGATWTARRNVPGRWYLLPVLGRAERDTRGGFDWGAETAGARLLAYSILYDAYGLEELADAAAFDLTRDVVSKWNMEQWQLTLMELTSYMAGWLLGRGAIPTFSQPSPWHLGKLPESDR